MLDWLVARKIATPNKTALVFQGQSITFAELDLFVQQAHLRFQSHEPIQAGSHVALLMTSSIDYVVTIFALMRMEVIIVPLNTRLTADELKWQITNADCRYVIYNSETEAQAAPLANSDCRVLSLDAIASTEIETLTDSTPGTCTESDELTGQVDLEAPFAIIHTSGTSGKPKGAVLTYGNIFYSAMASAYRLGHQLDDRWLSVLPLYHVGGLSIIMRAVLYGITVDLHARFDIDEINRSLSHEDITLISLVPTMLYRLLEQGTPADWNGLRLILLGGAAASNELLEQCKAHNLPVTTTYGLTEAASQVATMLPDETMQKPGSVGKPLMFTQVRVERESGEFAEPDEYGEIIVHGPTVMHGYYADAEATSRTLRDGWLHTGDIGYLDSDGDLWIIQRRSDLIISGGENVYPAEIEAILRQHPAVEDAAVVGVDHPEWGQQVGALVVLESPVTPAEITVFLRERLSGYKLPRLLHFTDHLPLTASGKIHTEAIRQMLQLHGKSI